MSNVEFIEDGHLYLNSNGIIIPSVSQLIKFQLGDSYSSVPPQVLERAAEYGTRIHALIQTYEDDADEFSLNNYKATDLKVLKDYIKLKEQCGFVVNNMEQIIDYQERFAGRYDMFCCDGCMYDIKTTSKLMVDHLEWQLGLYYLCMGIENDTAYCLWLPKNDNAQRVKIKPKTNKECIDLLERYEKENE